MQENNEQNNLNFSGLVLLVGNIVFAGTLPSSEFGARSKVRRHIVIISVI